MITSRLVSSESAGKALTARFRGIFGTSPRIFQALGLAHVIGERTDYNDGFVTPAALEFYTWVAAGSSDRGCDSWVLVSLRVVWHFLRVGEPTS
jgi:galactokinase